MGRLPEEVFLVEQLREGQVGFDYPKCASAWDLYLVGKLRLLAKPVREGEENMDGHASCIFTRTSVAVLPLSPPVWFTLLRSIVPC